MGQSASAPPPPVKPGEVVAGKYRVENAIAAGGMGLVFAARHVALDQAVALKFLRAELRGLISTSRFTMEARATAKLRSAHIARVFDVGVLDDGTPFMVMELLEGIDLEHLLEERGRLSADVAAELVTQACEAVNEAHEVGIIHRDLKPANLFLSRTPQGAPFVKVLDFGISKATIDPVSKSATVAGTILGSPPYMAPETLKSSKNADARSDIWALGVILYELVTGRLPFDGEGIGDLALKVHHEEPLWPVAIDPDIPKEYDEIVRTCLQKDAKERFASVEDLRDALVSFSSRRSASGMTLSLRTSQPRIVVVDERDGRPRTEERVKIAREATTLVHGATSVPLLRRVSPRVLLALATASAALVAVLIVVAARRLTPAAAQPEIIAVAPAAVRPPPPAPEDPVGVAEPPPPANPTASAEPPTVATVVPPAPPAPPRLAHPPRTTAIAKSAPPEAPAVAPPAVVAAPSGSSPPTKAIRDRGF